MDWTLIFATKAHIPRWLNKKTLHPGSVRSRLARHPPLFDECSRKQDRLELLKDAKTKSCSSCYSKTLSPESLMVVLSKRKLTKQIQKRRWKKNIKQNTTRVWASYHFLAKINSEQAVAGGRVSKCNFAAFDFGYLAWAVAWFPLPGTVVWVPCFIAPCCLSVCFSLAPAPSPLFRWGPWYTSVNYGGRWPPVCLKSLNTCLRRVCQAAPVQFLTTSFTNKNAESVLQSRFCLSSFWLSHSPDGINLVLFVSSSHSKPQS
jgi:hypothetical protein